MEGGLSCHHCHCACLPMTFPPTHALLPANITALALVPPLVLRACPIWKPTCPRYLPAMLLPARPQDRGSACFPNTPLPGCWWDGLGCHIPSHTLYLVPCLCLLTLCLQILPYHVHCLPLPALTCLPCLISLTPLPAFVPPCLALPATHTHAYLACHTTTFACPCILHACMSYLPCAFYLVLCFYYYATACFAGLRTGQGLDGGGSVLPAQMHAYLPPACLPVALPVLPGCCCYLPVPCKLLLHTC